MKSSIVRARAGAQWFGLAYQALCHRPLALLLLVGLISICNILVNRLPLIGQPLCHAILPFETLIVLIAAAESVAGRMSTSALLLYPFRAIRPHLRGLLALSAVHAIAFLLVLALVSSMSESGFAVLYLEDPRGTAKAGLPNLLSKFAMDILTMPLLLLQFAPALVYWLRTSVRQSISSSATACLRNWRALLVLCCIEGVIILLFGALAVLVMPPQATELMTLVVANICLIAPTATVFIAGLFAFRDIFAPETPLPAAPTCVAQA